MSARNIAFIALGCTVFASSATASGERLSFLACPQLHDTTPNCWTAEYQGEVYFIAVQRGPDQSYLPQMKHQILVEGEVSDAPRVCGGLVMNPVRLSVMPELDLSCDGPVLSGEGLTPPTLPPRRNRPAGSDAPPPAVVDDSIGSFMRADPPQPPFTTREFRVEFDFGTDILVDQMQKRVIEILTYIRAVEAKQVTIHGYSATTLLSNGRLLPEQEGLAEQRATKVRDILENLGVSEDIIEVEWADSPEEADGINDAERRRVLVTVTP